MNLSRLLFLFLWVPLVLKAGGTEEKVTIQWHDVISETVPGLGTIQYLSFDGAIYPDMGGWPVYFHAQPLKNSESGFVVSLQDGQYVPLTPAEQQVADAAELLPDEAEVRYSVGIDRGRAIGKVFVTPLRRNAVTGATEKLIAFTLVMEEQGKTGDAKVRKIEFADESAFKSGSWHQLKVSKRGVYKITQQMMQSWGMSLDGVHPDDIHLYGQGGDMLEQACGPIEYADIPENAIQVVTATPGVFGPDDYLLFYGDDPMKWNYSKFQNRFEHETNLYTKFCYYYLAVDNGYPGKRVATLSQSTLPVTDDVTSFNDFKVFEENKLSLIHTGKTWYSFLMNEGLAQLSLPPFVFPDIDKDYLSTIRTDVAGKSTEVSYFRFKEGNNMLVEADVPALSTNNSTTFARYSRDRERFHPSGDTINVSVNFDPGISTGKGWLLYAELNVRRALKMDGSQLSFIDEGSYGYGKVARYHLDNVTSNVAVWDVSDERHVKKLSVDYDAQKITFVQPNDTLHYYIAFTPEEVFTPEYVQPVPNQNLHAMQPVDYLMVTHPDFLEQAERLAQYHRENTGLSVAVVTTEQIYHEFGSGVADPAAIRNFVRMIYIRSQQTAPRYLMLFGDGTYDPLERLEPNHNFIPTFQSSESLSIGSSYLTDDYYAMMDDGEGEDGEGTLDVAVGRLPVVDITQAEQVVDKLLRYGTSDKNTRGSWKNRILFAADDGNKNMHLTQAEELSAEVDEVYPNLNVIKVYVDAFVQEKIPGGEFCKEGNKALCSNIDDGLLVVNYTGHGGETGWTDERLLTVGDVNGFTNSNSLPMFITATCEFSRFDDPLRLSAGEMVLLNPRGGGAGLITTSRLAFAGHNKDLNEKILEVLYDSGEGYAPRMGDYLRIAKNKTGNIRALRNFVLLGDPAMPLALPKYEAVITRFNDHEIIPDHDTVGAYGAITLEGEILLNGVPVSDYQGRIQALLYDKPATYTTLGQGNDTSPREFKMQDKLLNQVADTVIDGHFTMKFYVPKAIDYSPGNGFISLYAEGPQGDAAGHHETFILGGITPGAAQGDDEGPRVELYINDFSFVDGGTTHNKPLLLAQMHDEYGLNITRNGIGRDMVLSLNDNQYTTWMINDYYRPDFQSFQSGTVEFPLGELASGQHSVSVKVWDIFDNSTTSSISFVVDNMPKPEVMAMTVFPVPMRDVLNMKMVSNQYEKVSLAIDICDITGRLVSRHTLNDIDAVSLTQGVEIWDGRSISGMPMGDGWYTWSVTLTNIHGEHQQYHGSFVRAINLLNR